MMFVSDQDWRSCSVLCVYLALLPVGVGYSRLRLRMGWVVYFLVAILERFCGLVS
ncbi:hypothetical protein M6B38_127545 [Iris pallida]|uniref:Uncharacterized protein n=1 Tax=Iris pallida TaxID=29817 RepID=A0AAX6G4M0_IRIPA|nr:hypothetical protein M6B38_127545 [Iris pallida]